LNDENATELSSVFETYWRGAEAEPDFGAVRPEENGELRIREVRFDQGAMGDPDFCRSSIAWR
jgi:hypothetical protein